MPKTFEEEIKERKEALKQKGKKYIYEVREPEWEVFCDACPTSDIESILEYMIAMEDKSKFKDIEDMCGKKYDEGFVFSWAMKRLFLFSKNGPEYYRYLKNVKKDTYLCNKNMDKIIEQIDKENNSPDVEKIKKEKKLSHIKDKLADIEEKEEKLKKERDEIKQQEKKIKKERKALVEDLQDFKL